MLLLANAACANRYVPPPPAPEAPPEPLTRIRLDSLPAGTELRVATSGHRLEGRLAVVTADSLRLSRPFGDTVLTRVDIASAWQRGKESYEGTKSGAVAGLALGLLMLIAASQGAQPESNADGARFALLLVGGGLGLGILIDTLSPAGWLPVALR